MPPWEKYRRTGEVGPWEQYQAPQESPEEEIPSTAMVALQAVPKGIANLANLPVSIWNLAKMGAAELHPQIKESIEMTPNYPMKAMEAVGLVRPEYEPKTAAQRVIDVAVQAGTSVGALGLVSKAAQLPGLAKTAIETGKDIVVGMTSGGLAQITKEATGSDLLSIAVGVATPFAISRAWSPATKSTLTPVGKATLEEARSAGYVVQPSTVKPGAITTKIESVGGKAAISQQASARNQEITNQLAAKAIGLPENTPLSISAIEGIRKQAGKVYEEIEQLRPSIQMEWFPRFHERNLLDQLKQARANATAFYLEYYRQATVSTLRKAERAQSLAQSLENDIERIARAAGKPELIDQLHAARTLIARTYDVERALNVTDGNVSAQVIGRLLDQGKPITGELRTIGRFAQAFPRVSREAAMVPPAGVSAVDPFASAIFAGMGYGAAGEVGLAAAGLPLLRAPARTAMLSGIMQNRLLREPLPLYQSAIKGGAVGATLLDFKDVTER